MKLTLDNWKELIPKVRQNRVEADDKNAIEVIDMTYEAIEAAESLKNEPDVAEMLNESIDAFNVSLKKVLDEISESKKTGKKTSKYVTSAAIRTKVKRTASAKKRKGAFSYEEEEAEKPARKRTPKVKAEKPARVKKEKEKAPKPARVKKEKAPKAPKPAKTVQLMVRGDFTEAKHIKAYILLNEKQNLPNKKYADLLNRIQSDITLGKIRKTGKHAQYINDIQNMLVKILKEKGYISLKPETLAELAAAAGGAKEFPSMGVMAAWVRFRKSYDNKPEAKRKAELESIKTKVDAALAYADEDLYVEQVKEIKKDIDRLESGKGFHYDTLPLSGVLGYCHGTKKNSDKNIAKTKYSRNFASSKTKKDKAMSGGQIRLYDAYYVLPNGRDGSVLVKADNAQEALQIARHIGVKGEPDAKIKKVSFKRWVAR